MTQTTIPLDHPTLLPSELGLEHIKNITDLSREYERRINKRIAAFEDNLNGRQSVHLHGKADGRGVCIVHNTLTWSSEKRSGKRQPLMFVRVGDVSESSRPLTSVARLQPLNECLMSIGDPDKPLASIGNMTPPFLFGVFDRKLRARLDNARVLPSEDEDKIVKCGPEIVDGFPKENAESREPVWGEFMEGHDPRVISVKICRRYTFLNGVNFGFHFEDMVVCPTYPSIGALKRWFHGVSLGA